MSTRLHIAEAAGPTRRPLARRGAAPRLISVTPPLPPDVYSRGSAAPLPFPLAEPRCAVFARGRHALWQGVQALGLEPGDEVLVPAYHHGSEIEALLRAGLLPRFYAGQESLAPDDDELDALLGGRTRALYLIHHLGFPQDAAHWRAWCDERDVLLIEDARHAWLATTPGGPVGALGDLAVFSLPATVGVPDGGALVVRAPAPGPETKRRYGLGALAQQHIRWALQRVPALAHLPRMDTALDGDDPGADFELGDPGVAPSRATLFLLPRLANANVAERRRTNYVTLLDALADRVAAPFGELPAGASPFAFPLATRHKTALLARLEASGIAALDLWPEPHPSMPSSIRSADKRRARTVCVPVHQELRRDDLERIVDATRIPRRAREFELQTVDSLGDLRDEWQQLALQSRNVFSTWEWMDVWLRHFRPRGRLAITACRARDGRLVAIFPLYHFASAPVTVLRFLGHGPADELGPVCAARDRDLAIRGLRQLLVEMRPDVFLAEQVPGNERWPARLGGRTLRREGSPILRFEGMDWEGVLASRSANLRQQIRRFERRLLHQHDVRYRFADDPDRLSDDLDLLFELHRERWKENESAFGGSQADFHREFARAAFERGWLRLWFLELDGQPVSSWYGFRFGDVESYYQAGRDPAWEHASVGFVLLSHSIRTAVEDGMHEYRFLRGSESFKYRFANVDPGLETVGVGRTGVADAALAAGRAVPPPVTSYIRRWVAGAGQQRI